jgi:hypothetical protein
MPRWFSVRFIRQIQCPVGASNRCSSRPTFCHASGRAGAGFTVRHRLYAIQSLFTGTIATSIRAYMEAAGFAIEEIIERDPYSPEVEHQSRRAYIFARKPSSAAQPS